MFQLSIYRPTVAQPNSKTLNRLAGTPRSEDLLFRWAGPSSAGSLPNRREARKDRHEGRILLRISRGPSVHIRVNDGLGADLKLDKLALGRFAMRLLCGIEELEKR